MVSTNPSLTLKLLKALVKIPSVNPSIEEGDGEVAIADYISRWFRKTGKFRVIEQTVDKDRYNVLAFLDGMGNGRSLMLNGHMDTVGTSYMKVNPFRPTIKNGRVYGRGSCDMKGALAAMMSATLALAHRDRPSGNVIFSAVVDEEQGSKGIAKLAERFRSEAAIVGEPTNMDIAVAHKGYAWLEISTIGKEAHGSVPERGVDAIEKMAIIVSGLNKLRRQYKSKQHPLVGSPRIHTSAISGGTDWSTIPGRCVLRVERRLIPGETQEDALREIRRLVREVSRDDRNVRANVRLIHHADSMEVDRSTSHVRILYKNAKRLAGRVRIIGVPYWTDAAILVNRARIPTCLFGPGDIKVAHGRNENVKISDVVKAAQIYAETASDYCDIRGPAGLR